MKKWLAIMLLVSPLILEAQGFERQQYNSEGNVVAVYSGMDYDNFDFVKFHDNGKKMSTGAYVEGKKHGTWKTWNESGQLVAKAKYKYGEKSGKWMIYDESEKNVFHIRFGDNSVKEATRIDQKGKIIARR